MPWISKIKINPGDRFNRWLVVGQMRTRDRTIKVLCRCDCGSTRDINAYDLLRGKSTSCGCAHSDELSARNLVHGKSEIPEYDIWGGIIQRCCNPENKAYLNYGGRGITMCPRWRNSFEDFLQDVGQRPSAKHTIERIDNNKGYEPENCKWATRKEQNRNRRNNRIVSYCGKSMSATEWACSSGIPASTIIARLNHGWSVELALTTKPMTNAQSGKFACERRWHGLSREEALQCA